MDAGSGKRGGSGGGETGGGEAGGGVPGGSPNVELEAFINPFEILVESSDSSDEESGRRYSSRAEPSAASSSRPFRSRSLHHNRDLSSQSLPLSRSPSPPSASTSYLLPHHHEHQRYSSRSSRDHRTVKPATAWSFGWLRHRATMLIFAVSLVFLAFYGAVWGGPLRRQAGEATTSPPWYPARE